MLLYLDTNIVMDHLLDRYDPSSELVEAALACRHEVLISNLTLRELERNGVDATGFLLVLAATEKLRYCNATDEDRRAAAAIVATHFADALHKVLAKRHRADVLVTRNVKDFAPFSDIAVRRPDDI